MCGACFHTRGRLPIRTVIALHNAMNALMPDEPTKRADHDAGPTADTRVRIDSNLPRLFVSPNRTRNARLNAHRILAISTLERKRSVPGQRAFVINEFDTDPPGGYHGLLHCFHQSLGF